VKLIDLLVCGNMLFYRQQISLLNTVMAESGMICVCCFRICYCTADRVHERVFAYIARNRENETMECHAFLCPKRKIVSNVKYNYNNNNYYYYVNIDSAVIMARPLQEFTHIICRMQTECQVAANRQTKLTDLGCESAYRLLQSTHTVTICFYYSVRSLILILLFHVG